MGNTNTDGKEVRLSDVWLGILMLTLMAGGSYLLGRSHGKELATEERTAAVVKRLDALADRAACLVHRDDHVTN